jgi:hypothetical protein
MPGCPYCGEMHSQLYICDAMKAARAAVDTSPKVSTASPKTVDIASPKKVNSGYERNKRWREKHREAYRAGQRSLMRKRYAELKR